MQVPGERLCVLPAVDYLDEPLGEFPLVRIGQVLVVFDGIGDAAQQVGIADHLLQRVGQLRNGQGKGARDALENFILVGKVCWRG